MKMVKTFVKTQHQTAMLPEKKKIIYIYNAKQLTLFLAKVTRGPRPQHTFIRYRRNEGEGFI